MKSKYILFPAALFALLALKSCLIDSKSLSEPFGILQVEIAESMGAVTRADDNTMESIRFIVFTDLDSSTPRAEINNLYTDFDVEPAVGTTPPRVRFSLKVERKPTGSNKKLVVAIVNEPASMTSALSGSDITIDELEDLQLDIDLFVNSDHLSLQSDMAIPMTGAIWTDKLFSTETEAMSVNNLLRMQVQRAVARVDVYLKKGTDVDPDMKYITGSTIKLENTYDKSNFIMYSDGINTLGTIQTVAASDFLTKTWSYTAATPQAISDATPVCVFYTPERNHTADRLELSISIKTPEGATRTGTLEITKAYEADDPDKELKDVNVIRRNHIYKVIATIEANGITGDVVDWNEEDITTEF